MHQLHGAQCLGDLAQLSKESVVFTALAGSYNPAITKSTGTHWIGTSSAWRPLSGHSYPADLRSLSLQCSSGHAGSHDPAVTEKYWQLLELMRQEFLADIAEYYNCMAPNIQGQMQPAYASKLAKMKSVIQRLSVRSALNKTPPKPLQNSPPCVFQSSSPPIKGLLGGLTNLGRRHRLVGSQHMLASCLGRMMVPWRGWDSPVQTSLLQRVMSALNT